MPRDLTLRIIVEDPPTGVDFASQKGKGSAFEPIQQQRSTGNDLVFEFQPVLRPGSSGGSSLGGPFVQGPPRGRFAYLDIGTCAGQLDSNWTRRLKIPLEGLTPEMVARGGVFEARVPGKDNKGGPNCATVRDFQGWRPAKR